MKSIPVSSILYFLLSLGVLFVNANTFTDSQIFPKWMFMFTGLGVIGCFFSFYLFLSYPKAQPFWKAHLSLPQTGQN